MAALETIQSLLVVDFCLLESAEGVDSFKLANVTSSTVKGGEGADFVSATGLISQVLFTEIAVLTRSRSQVLLPKQLPMAVLAMTP